MAQTPSNSGRHKLADTAPASLSPSEFEQSRRRKSKETTLNVAVGGFGPKGQYTLFLPTPAPKFGYIFKDGKPVRQVSSSVMGQAHIVKLRDQVIAGMSSEGPGILGVPAAFLEYVAAVIKLTYEVSDDDLTFLLSGTGFQKNMIAHLLGGNDVMTALRALAPRLIPASAPAIPPPALAIQGPVPAAHTPLPPHTPVRRFVARIFRLLRRV